MRFLIALALVLAGQTCRAQQFSDVLPANHWSYDALLRLRDKGVLVGYPDKKFRGSRNATRYEMAAFIHGQYDYFKRVTDEQGTRIKAIEDLHRGCFSFAEWDAIQKEIADIRVARDGILRWRDELDDLKRLSKEFEKELTALGLDLAAMRDDVKDIQKRVKALEGKG